MNRMRNNESGVALTMVVIVGFAMMLLVVSSMAFSMNSLDLSRRDQDWGAALAAAEAGIDDYLYRLNRIDAYWQYSESNPPPPAVDVNPAFTGWTPVPGAENEAKFRYRVDSSAFASAGIIKIAATGLLRDTTRTVYGTLRRRHFLDYLYFTEYETKDPAIYDRALGDPFDAATANSLCTRHYYGAPPRDNDCIDINFITADRIRGPLHTNDAFLVCGNPRFEGETSTSFPGSPPTGGRRYRRNPMGGCSPNNPVFSVAGDPALKDPLKIPPSNTSMKNYTNPLLGETGCLYTGPTRITLNSSGTMNVTSPLTRESNCATGSNVPLPDNGVVYVQNVPTSPDDPNYPSWPGNTCPGHPLGYPIPQDITRYDCRSGDVFLSGTLRGRVTIAAGNNIVITGDTVYQSATADLLGLVADNFVEVYHPIRCSRVSGGRCVEWAEMVSNTNVDIHAAILSVRHSFRVQNYHFGTPRGTLTVIGAISQKFRGIVGRGAPSVITGFAKDYRYDQRLKFQSPPHFLDPVQSAWQVATWAEMKPCYPHRNGAVRNEAPCA